MGDVKEALLGEMAAYFGSDARRVDHARMVTGYAEEIWRREGGDYRIIIGAAVLHDVGIHQAEKKHRSTAGKFQEIEGPHIARPILARLGFTPEETGKSAVSSPITTVPVLSPAATSAFYTTLTGWSI